MVNLLITDEDQIGDVFRGMEVEAAAKRASALPKRAAELHADLKGQLAIILALVAPHCSPDGMDALEHFFDLANQRADELAAIPAQASDVLTHSAFLTMQLMKQRNAKTAELAGLVDALEQGDDTNLLLKQFLDRVDERRADYSHVEAILQSEDAASTLADIFMGREEVPADELDGLIGALIGMWERKTGRRVSVHLVGDAAAEVETEPVAVNGYAVEKRGNGRRAQR